MGASLNCKACFNTDNTENELDTFHSITNNTNTSSQHNPHFIKLQNHFAKLKQQTVTINGFSQNNFITLFNNATTNYDNILTDCNEQLNELQPSSTSTHLVKLQPLQIESTSTNEKEFYDCSVNINSGAIEGNGSYVDDKGNAYRGQFKNNMFDGVGFYVSRYGDYYYGEWKEGVYHGKGEYATKNGCKYNGEFERGMKHGNGEEVYADGSFYSGEFVNGKKNGNGKLEFKDGSFYVGEFVDDEFNGEGEYQFSDGRFYKGRFEKGKMMGKPVQKENNGIKKEITWGEQDLVNFE